jgi:hypothetical protein
MWKEAGVAYFKLLSMHSHGGTEQNREEHSGQSAPSLESKWIPPG